MADTKISALSSAGALAGTEPVPIVQSGSTVQTTAQDIADLASSSNLGNADLTSSAAARVFTLAGNTATDYLEIEKNSGTAIIQFRGDGRLLFGSTDFKQGSAGGYNWLLGGSASTDDFTIQNAAASDVLKVQGDSKVRMDSHVGIGVAPSATYALDLTNNIYGMRAVATIANGRAGTFNANVGGGTAIGLDVTATGAGGVGSRYGVRIDASGGTNNHALEIEGGNFNFNDTTNGCKIGMTTSQKFGFWNTTPIVQPSAMTAQLTDITGDITPSTPDYVVAATSGGWGFGSQDEFETAMNVINNLQTRVQELEDALSTAAGGVGLIA